MPDLLGQTLDHYRIDRLLGQGGMGMIYQATDVKLQRQVAIKVMHEHLASHKQFQDRFVQEAQAAAMLDHPNIVRVIEFSPPPNKQLYLVMELITGGSLRDYLNRLPSTQRILSLSETLQLVRQMAEALHYAHQHGMIHRDVKPENILLKPMSASPERHAFQAMLTDFGLAKMGEGIAQTMTGRPLGTFPYMSPEQCVGDRNIDGRTDIYALGVVLFELTVGRLPYQPQNIMEAFRMHSQDPIPVPSSIRPDFPKTLEPIIFKCLAKKREDRYQTAADLANALHWYQAELESDLKLSDTATQHVTGVAQEIAKQPTNVPPPAASAAPAPPLPADIEDRPTAPEDIATEPPPAPPPQPQPQYAVQPPPQIQPQFPMVAPPQTQPPTQPETQPELADHDRVVISLPGHPDRSVAITKEVMIIGRDPHKDIVLDDKSVSREHASLEHKPDGTFWIRDLGSTNGILMGDELIEPNRPHEWVPGQEVIVGEFKLRLESEVVRSSGYAQYNVSMADAGYSAPPSFQVSMLNVQGDSAQNLTVTMKPSNVKVKLGETVEINVGITNPTGIREHLTLEVRGAPAEWASIANEEIELLPGGSAATIISFTPPRRWTSRAGRHVFTLRLHSVIQQMEVAKITGALHIAPYQDFVADLYPKRLHDGGRATLTITNHSNTMGDFSLRARDRESKLSFAFERSRVSVEAGQSEQIALDVTPNQNALAHGANLLPFEVTIASASGEERAAQGEVLAVAYLVSQQPIPAYAGVAPMMPDLQPAVPAPAYQPPPAHEPAQEGHPSARRRGGCLTLWLILFSLVGLAMIPGLILAAFAVGIILPSGNPNGWLFVILLIVSWIYALVFGLVVIQTWNWRRWALNLLMFLSFFMFPIGPFLTLIWWMLTAGKRRMFE